MCTLIWYVLCMVLWIVWWWFFRVETCRCEDCLWINGCVCLSYTFFIIYSPWPVMLRSGSSWGFCSVICYTGRRPLNLIKSRIRITSKGNEKLSLFMNYWGTVPLFTLVKNCRSLTPIRSKVNSACIRNTKSLRTLSKLSHRLPLTKLQVLRPQLFTLYVSEFYNTLQGCRLKKKTIERSPFFLRRGGHCCRGDLVGRTNFWIVFEWLAKVRVWSL